MPESITMLYSETKMKNLQSHVKYSTNLVRTTPEYSVLLGLVIGKPKQLHMNVTNDDDSEVLDVFWLCIQQASHHDHS